MELHPIAIFPDNYKNVLDNYAVKIGRGYREKSHKVCRLKKKAYLCTAKTVESASIFAVGDKNSGDFFPQDCHHRRQCKGISLSPTMIRQRNDFRLCFRKRKGVLAIIGNLYYMKHLQLFFALAIPFRHCSSSL